MNTTEQMCPFCPLFVEPELRDTIENGFFGEAANVCGVPSCAGCAIVAQMDDDEGAWMIEAVKELAA